MKTPDNKKLAEVLARISVALDKGEPVSDELFHLAGLGIMHRIENRAVQRNNVKSQELCSAAKKVVGLLSGRHV